MQLVEIQPFSVITNVTMEAVLLILATTTVTAPLIAEASIRTVIAIIALEVAASQVDLSRQPIQAINNASKHQQMTMI